MKSCSLPVFCDPPRRNLNRFLWMAPVLFAVMLGSASADSVRIFLHPNIVGDNFSFFASGVGYSVGVSGGVPSDFFGGLFPEDGRAPGSEFGGSADIFFCCGFAQFGRNTYDLGFSGPGSLFMTTSTFPTNGKDFVTFQVRIDVSIPGLIVDPNTGETRDFGIGGSANGTISFRLDSNGLYYPADDIGFVQAPEPGTLGLMGSGLIGIFALARRRLKV
jgi:hypothetical protein